jgi:hypothetical protein
VVTWIVVGSIVLGVVILVASGLAVLGRLRPLADAGRRLRIRTEQAQRLRVKVEALQERLAEMEGSLTETLDRAAARRR